MSLPRSSRKCRCCQQAFLPSKGNRGRQRFCAQQGCRKASKAQAQRKWSRQAQNRDYFRGAAHVERVRQWRKQNPGYHRGQTAARPLQDFAQAQVPVAEPLAAPPQGLSRVFSQKESAASAPGASEAVRLQDFAHRQDPLLVGLICALVGEPLQDNVASVVRQLVEQGRRVLARDPEGLGLGRAGSPFQSRSFDDAKTTS